MFAINSPSDYSETQRKINDCKIKMFLIYNTQDCQCISLLVQIYKMREKINDFKIKKFVTVYLPYILLILVFLRSFFSVDSKLLKWSITVKKTVRFKTFMNC